MTTNEAGAMAEGSQIKMTVIVRGIPVIWHVSPFCTVSWRSTPFGAMLHCGGLSPVGSQSLSTEQPNVPIRKVARSDRVVVLSAVVVRV